MVYNSPYSSNSSMKHGGRAIWLGITLLGACAIISPFFVLHRMHSFTSRLALTDGDARHRIDCYVPSTDGSSGRRGLRRVDCVIAIPPQSYQQSQSAEEGRPQSAGGERTNLQGWGLQGGETLNTRLPQVSQSSECSKVNVTAMIHNSVSEHPGSRRRIIHYDMSVGNALSPLLGPDGQPLAAEDQRKAKFDIVVPTVTEEQAETTADWIADVLSSGQPWEQFETNLVADKLEECRMHNKGDKSKCGFVDLGANLGWYAIVVGSMGYPVVAFEANPQLYSGLYTTINLYSNRFYLGSKVPDIQLIPFGLGAEYMECHLFSPSVNFYGSASVSCPPVGELDEIKLSMGLIGMEYRGPVVVAPGDCFLQGTHSPYVLKIDVEGFEILAFKGMREFFQTNPPRYIVSEVQSNHQRRQGFSSEEYVEAVQAMGYSCHVLGDPKKTPILPIAVDDDTKKLSIDRNMFCEFMNWKILV
eukprot:GHVQ01012574.1.p1 GENE.GHVQ01012574.1~~GHVQ01012574.1.p1  ORF type:complete len:472 (+),score=53.67 GHVQ01012574.1:57-1472(+)